MTDPIGGSQGASSVATQLSVAGAKTANDVQKQEGEAVANLLETAVSSAEGGTGQQVDVTA